MLVVFVPNGPKRKFKAHLIYYHLTLFQFVSRGKAENWSRWLNVFAFLKQMSFLDYRKWKLKASATERYEIESGRINHGKPLECSSPSQLSLPIPALRLFFSLLEFTRSFPAAGLSPPHMLHASPSEFWLHIRPWQQLSSFLKAGRLESSWV